MNVADIVILVVLGLSALFGLLRGFVREVLSLACWVAAFWVAWAFGPQVAAFYGQWWHAPAARLIAGYITCFIGVVVLGSLLEWPLNKLVVRGGLRGGDRFFGVLFGVVRGLVLVTFAVWMLGFTRVPQQTTWWRQSVLLPPFESGASRAAALLPPKVTHDLQRGGRSLRDLPPISTGSPRRGVPSSAPGSAPAPAERAPVRATGHRSPHGDVGQ